MAMVVRELLVKLGIQTNQSDINTANQRISKVADAARTLGTVLATGAVAVGFKRMIDLASDASETANKFGAIFGEAADTTQAALDRTAAATGASNMALQDYASSLGGILKPALGSAEAAGEMSARLSEIALDIASFNNLEPEVALEKLRAGLLGSVEPMDQVGVNLRANNIGLKEYAEANGVATTAVSEQTKIQLRYQAILKQLGVQGALGDATKTAEGFANSSRALTGQLKELGATLGSFFLKSVERSTRGTLKLVQQVNRWFEANREVVQQRIDRALEVLGRITDGLVTAFTFLADAGKAWFSVLDEGQTTLTAFLITLAGLIVLLGLPVALLIAIGAAILLIIDDLEAMGAGGDSVIGTLITRFQELVAELGGYPEAIKEFLGTASDYWLEYFGGLFGMSKKSTDDLKQNVRGLGNTFLEVFKAIGRIIDNVIGLMAENFAGLFEAVSQAMRGNLTGAGRTMLMILGNQAGRIGDTLDALTGDALFGGEARQRAGDMVDVVTGSADTATVRRAYQDEVNETMARIERQAQDRAIAEGRLVPMSVPEDPAAMVSMPPPEAEPGMSVPLGEQVAAAGIEDPEQAARVAAMFAAASARFNAANDAPPPPVVQFNEQRQRTGQVPTPAPVQAAVPSVSAPQVVTAPPAVAAQAQANQAVTSTTNAQISVYPSAGMDEARLAAKVRDEIESYDAAKMREVRNALAPAAAGGG